MFIPLVGSLVTLGLLYWKRHSHPTNYIMLAAFTLFESLSVGLIVSYYDSVIVLQAM